MKKIGIIGVHGAGKTTLAYTLSAHFKKKAINVKLIHESARENCPFPLNEDATVGTCLWNFHKQFLNELEAETQGYELAICDRSVLDTFVYFHAVNDEKPITRFAMLQAIEWLTTYDFLICLEPDATFAIGHDGIRAMDIDYQMQIRDAFHTLLTDQGKKLENKLLFCKCETIFNEQLHEELMTKVENLLQLPQLATTSQ